VPATCPGRRHHHLDASPDAIRHLAGGGMHTRDARRRALQPCFGPGRCAHRPARLGSSSARPAPEPKHRAPTVAGRARGEEEVRAMLCRRDLLTGWRRHAKDRVRHTGGTRDVQRDARASLVKAPCAGREVGHRGRATGDDQPRRTGRIPSCLLVGVTGPPIVARDRTLGWRTGGSPSLRPVALLWVQHRCEPCTLREACDRARLSL
jgi:hypothetical protein